MKKILLIVAGIILFTGASGQNFGLAISLDGVDDYGIVPHHESLDPYDGSWSMCCWLKAANKDQVAPIVMKRDPQSPWTQYSYAFGMDDPHEPQPGKRIRVNHIEAAGASERSGHTTNEVIDGSWHHIAVIADKAQDGIIIYLDGTPIDFVALFYYGAWPDVHTSFELFIARGSGGDKIEGMMDELSIWNKALTQGEIQTFMSNPIPPVYYETDDSSLVAYYSFEQFEDLGIGTAGINDIRDKSIHANHMGAEGMPILVPSISLAGLNEGQPGKIDFELYPNPCQDELTIKLQTSDINYQVSDIIDTRGSTVKSISLRGRENTIDVSDLPEGMYFVRVSNGNNSSLQKLLIR